ncbi:O-antigen ligase family protein [Ketobacter sp.]|uniref:O-antigen ligase family protein n=1 Tax=Ketobacter sp. TaxID=2083498 RepID=UPI000F1064EC|nr:O-antigen ligase family protein [Ketobacter sp.]RLT96777.1 MAG: O-antigen ligase domain-containing protein [Ketobacter sp.]
MTTTAIRHDTAISQNTVTSTEERLIWIGIVFTYGFYLTGTLYVVGSLIGWALLAMVLLRAFVEGRWPERAVVPATVWVWIIGMLVMLVALWVAHHDYNMGSGQTIKSSIGWAKGWALLALFPLLGAVIHFKPAVLVRACCVLAAQAIVFVPLGLAGFMVGLDGPLYLSPLKAIGGPISTFEVNLFGMNPESGRPRWPFFAPWAPAAGLMACIYLVICSQERNRFWRNAGVVGALFMCLFCQSRAGWAIFVMLIPALIVFRRLPLPMALLMLGTLACVVLLLGQPIYEGVMDLYQQAKDSRPGSTRVRAALANLALQRWQAEAPIWGHGVIETGPKMVEFMPIGSHHSWYGLLFVKGLVGLFALAIPMAITALYLVLVCGDRPAIWVSILLMTILVCYSFFENLEILAYLLWPALLWLGMTLNPLKEGEQPDD